MTRDVRRPEQISHQLPKPMDRYSQQVQPSSTQLDQPSLMQQSQISSASGDVLMKQFQGTVGIQNSTFQKTEK